MKKAFLIGCLIIAAVTQTVSGADTWDLATFDRLMKVSGRKATMNEQAFTEVQSRKPEYMRTIENYLQGLLGSIDQTVLKAFGDVPREYFMYNYEKNQSFADLTYSAPPHPWAIGYGSYLSDYRAQAYMTQVLQPKASDVSLEIGTGSGFQSAVLSRIVREAYTIEIITDLGDKVHNIYAPIRYDNVHIRVGDGYYGWPEVKGGFDIIIVTCAAPYVPPALLEQLKPNGRMIVPIGQPYKTQFFYVFTKDLEGKVHSRRDIATYFIPMTGRVQQGPP